MDQEQDIGEIVRLAARSLPLGHCPICRRRWRDLAPYLFAATPLERRCYTHVLCNVCLRARTSCYYCSKAYQPWTEGIRGATDENMIHSFCRRMA